MSKAQIKAILGNEFNYYGAPLNEGQIELWAQDLSSLTVMEIQRALKTLRADPFRTRPPFPAQIIDAAFQHPGPEEAWSLCPHDEHKSVVWTDQIRGAFGMVRELIYQGDTIGARMAFKEIYLRNIQAAKHEKIRPNWTVSLGHDKEHRDEALKEAVAKNLLTIEQAKSYSPELELKQNYLPGAKVLQIAGRESSQGMTEEEREKNLANIQVLKDMLAKKTK